MAEGLPCNVIGGFGIQGRITMSTMHYVLFTLYNLIVIGLCFFNLSEQCGEAGCISWRIINAMALLGFCWGVVVAVIVQNRFADPDDQNTAKNLLHITTCGIFLFLYGFIFGP